MMGSGVRVPASALSTEAESPGRPQFRFLHPERIEGLGGALQATTDEQMTSSHRATSRGGFSSISAAARLRMRGHESCRDTPSACVTSSTARCAASDDRRRVVVLDVDAEDLLELTADLEILRSG